MSSRTFSPSPDSPNRLERLAYFAKEAGDFETADAAEKEFSREGTEDDCYADDYYA